ncbi:MAG: protease modulator HflC [Calditrichaeota bacterium]|nr:MAG: protease modulator HflC [Calditrichota bacterium]MBL1204829.1 protease modulator HflC [Calditrichota bacterium]NOG44658.1 protease modulator HflC [Calditrichota bacterium]
MENKKTLISVAVVFFVIILINAAAYTVKETQQVIITQFGELQRTITDPGIHFKIPLMENANFFDKRFLEWDGDPNQLPTKDKRYIHVDTYARWRISDPLLFFERVRDELGAQGRLDDILDGETRNAVANHDLVEIVRNTNRTPVIVDSLVQDQAQNTFPTIKVGRAQISQEILKNASVRTKELGIELLDLRFKRINYIEEVRRKVYERMITERKRIADKFRSEGQGAASKILGDKERELKRIQSEAYRKSQEIVGKADAEATAIYARAFNQNAEAREFYRFMETLKTYKKTFTSEDVLILSTDSEYYKFLQKASGR